MKPSSNMRTYSFSASRPGGLMFHPSRTIQSRSRIGVVVRLMFRKWFGRCPDKLVWHKDGFMAEAWDKRGNHVMVEQDNHWHPYFRKFGIGLPAVRKPSFFDTLEKQLEAGV